MKNFKWNSPFGWNRRSIRALLTLISLSLFAIVIIVDLIAYFLDKDLSYLFILTLLLGTLVSCEIGFYFGQRMYQDSEKKEKQFLAKPEVRSFNRPNSSEDNEKIIKERFESWH